MSVLSKEEYLANIKNRIGDDNSDEAMAFLENMNDTYADLESKVNGDGINWKEKYEENDKNWREKYKSRFFETGTTPDEVLLKQKYDVQRDSSVQTFNDLFKEREG